MSVADELNSIENLEGKNLEKLENTLEKIEGSQDPEVLRALLGVLERCADEEDFGLFSSIENRIGEFPPEIRDAEVEASFRRRPMWKTLELVSGQKDLIREVLESKEWDERTEELLREELGE